MPVRLLIYIYCNSVHRGMFRQKRHIAEGKENLFPFSAMILSLGYFYPLVFLSFRMIFFRLNLFLYVLGRNRNLRFDTFLFLFRHDLLLHDSRWD